MPYNVIGHLLDSSTARWSICQSFYGDTSTSNVLGNFSWNLSDLCNYVLSRWEGSWSNRHCKRFENKEYDSLSAKMRDLEQNQPGQGPLSARTQNRDRLPLGSSQFGAPIGACNFSAFSGASNAMDEGENQNTWKPEPHRTPNWPVTDYSYVQQEFKVIKDALQRIKLPSDLRVEDSRQGVKRRHQHRIKWWPNVLIMQKQLLNSYPQSTIR